MKEFDQSLKTVFLAIPEQLRDYLTVKFATYYLDFGPSHMVKTGRARYWGHQMLMRWYRGKPTPLSEWAPKLLDGCKLKVQGTENFGEGGIIIVINQPNEGILRGNWFKFLLNYAVAEAKGRQGNFEARWVQRADSNNPIIQKTPLSIQKRRLSQMIAKSCGTILIDSRADSGRANLRSLFEMKRHLQDGGVLVICPEGQDHKVLGRGKREAGELLLFLRGKTGAPICPAAAWNQGDTLNLRFGEVIKMGTFFGDGQKMADLAMVKIAELLPEEKRGAYKKIVEKDFSFRQNVKG